jgi:deoxyribodipyrimidine photo-lyase
MSPPPRPTLLWFRRDLRLQDNPALHAALARGRPIVPVFIWDPAGEGEAAPGAASRAWLHRSLAALDASLRQRESRLILTSGASGTVLLELARGIGADAVYWNRRYEPAVVGRDARVQAQLEQAGLEVHTANAALLHEPTAIANQQGRPFQVFTPYWRRCLAESVTPPVKLREKILPGPAAWPASTQLDTLGLRPTAAWDEPMLRDWTPGEAGATERLRRFVAHGLADYAEDRDWPAREGTSQLSPHLAWGEIGPRQIWAAVRATSRDSGIFPPGRGAEYFLSELGWREFSYHVLFHFPHMVSQPLRAEFSAFPWADDPGGAHVGAWQRGRTGYPIVDAGMRQLWQTGWMHNRVRMIVASFLVKHLRLPWTTGMAWFRDTLVDADLANNTLGWQWSAGCGADAAPYFRIFSPVRQAQKFDPDGDYVRRWVPELARLPAAHIHSPWAAPTDELAAAGVRLGENYPPPLVEHAAARAAALAAWQSLRTRRPT